MLFTDTNIYAFYGMSFYNNREPQQPKQDKKNHLVGLEIESMSVEKHTPQFRSFEKIEIKFEYLHNGAELYWQMYGIAWKLKPGLYLYASLPTLGLRSSNRQTSTHELNQLSFSGTMNSGLGYIHRHKNFTVVPKLDLAAGYIKNFIDIYEKDSEYSLDTRHPTKNWRFSSEVDISWKKNRYLGFATEFKYTLDQVDINKQDGTTSINRPNVLNHEFVLFAKVHIEEYFEIIMDWFTPSIGIPTGK
ncbi:hypothetical protein ACFL5G_02770 [Candidatus Margulisiibacteriota bacterium]